MRSLLTAAVIGVAAACGPRATPADFDRAAVADSVTAAMRAYAAAFPGRDADAVTRFYLNDPDFRVYFDGALSRYDEMVAIVRNLLGSLRSIEGSFDDIQVTVLGPGAAVATTPFRDVLVDTTGTTTRLRGLVSWTWVRRSEGWRIIHGHAVHVPDTAAATH